MLKNVLIPGNKSESDRKNIMFLQNKEYIFEKLIIHQLIAKEPTESDPKKMLLTYHYKERHHFFQSCFFPERLNFCNF